MAKWGGRRVRPLIELVLQTKGTTCHLCGLPGADSADHNPPRSELVALGVLDPDDPAYLFPAHRRPCNITRKARPITDDLRSMLRARRLAYIGTPTPSPDLSPRFAAFFDARDGAEWVAPSPFISKGSSKKPVKRQAKRTDRD